MSSASISIGIFLVLMAEGLLGYILPCGLCMYAVAS